METLPASLNVPHAMATVRPSDQLSECLVGEPYLLPRTCDSTMEGLILPRIPREGGPPQAVEGAFPARTQRADGWTPDRIRTFLTMLSQCGVVADAARAAGMSKQSAYAFRNSARGRAFDVAWRAALLLARSRIADEVMSRAINGCVEVIMRDGEVWGERHRYDNRLTMAVLTRLDGLANSGLQLNDAPRRVAYEFDQFVDAVCAGGEEAADFIESREALPYRAFDEASIIYRNEEHAAREEGEQDEWQPSTSSTLPVIDVEGRDH